MKAKALIGCVLIAVMLSMTSPALALSLGVSPTHVNLEVPSDGSITTTVQVHYFDGDVQISLVDIPLRIEPSVVYVNALNNPVPIELTIYGDSSLGSQVYDGYIRLIAVSGGAATGGVQIIAKITNIADGVTPSAPPVLATKELEVEVEESKPVAEVQTPEAVSPIVVDETLPQSPPPATVKPGIPTTPIIISLGVLVVVLILVIVKIQLRRRVI